MIYTKILGIGASDPKGVIGKNGKLPWHYPEDLRHFEETIQKFPIVMGYKTFITLPDHYFEKRAAIIFTRQQRHSSSNKYFVRSLIEFINLKGRFKDLYVIGGAEIYQLFMRENLMNEFILTKINQVYEGDTHFALSMLDGWKEQIVHTTPDFTIYRYINPLETAHAHKSL